MLLISNVSTVAYEECVRHTFRRINVRKLATGAMGEEKTELANDIHAFLEHLCMQSEICLDLFRLCFVCKTKQQTMCVIKFIADPFFEFWVVQKTLI